ncbi:type II toxin-antitoxin system RelE/ParE family toxin [Dyadobacter sp. CY356]|uniref:type II toxin-antitoxin system RelE/ParE family toxin n=1 Tax=Dyadobacter sp. CY356 TaxID=2906442 RepID=UPI001F1C9138|nr:type II toxin-antitoxin system RelE/ParE family toxin [Dyadobacter sp. CY356]MCF0058723.1 type II toxin-antitoxin system RelE/ParE family toxin [Dyadobacter sp. CY356]
MIRNFLHKGLQQYYEDGNGSKLPSQYLRKINRLFDELDAVDSIDDIKKMGSGVHKLSGKMSDFWSVTITPNYRMIFRFEEHDVCDVDFLDYH